MPDHDPINHAGRNRGRICFRGDVGDEFISREPDVMFRTGFKSRKPDVKIASPRMGQMAVKIAKRDALYYNQMDPTRQVVYTKDAALKKFGNLNIATSTGVKDLKKVEGDFHVALLPTVADIATPTAVCVTARFATAILFPPKMQKLSKNTPPLTWVYAVYVRDYHNTHTSQTLQGMKAIQDLYRTHAAIEANSPTGKKSLADKASVMDTYVEHSGFWPLWAQELATKEIEPEDVICAVKVEREWGENQDWTHGCSYNIWKNTLVSNEGCTLDQSIINAVVKFIRDEPKTGRTPSRTSGFYRDSEQARMSVELSNTADGRRLGQFQ